MQIQFPQHCGFLASDVAQNIASVYWNTQLCLNPIKFKLSQVSKGQTAKYEQSVVPAVRCCLLSELLPASRRVLLHFSRLTADCKQSISRLIQGHIYEV
jgi:hypothetical protein